MTRKHNTYGAAANVAAAVALAIAVPGFASAAEELEEVQVTGSRIAQAPGMFTPTPVTSVQIEELKQMSPGTLIESLSQLPQFFGNPTGQQALGGQNSGGSNVNLRGAGINRTLVLLDGRRVVSSNRFGTVDVNMFPDMLLNGVETVTGGASASYGTDAVAGVVNFKLNTKFEGLKFHGQAGQTSRQDGENAEFGVAFGHKFGDRLNVVGSFAQSNQNPISDLDGQKSRPWFNQEGRVTNPDAVNGPAFLRRAYVMPTNFNANGLFVDTAVPTLNRLTFNGLGTSLSPLPFYGVGNLNGGCQCQALPVQDYGVNVDREVEAGYTRTNGFLHLDYELNDHVTLYAQGMYGKNQANTRRESISLLSIWQGRIYSDNAFLPANLQDQISAATASRRAATVTPVSAADAARLAITNPSYVGFGVFLPNNADNPIGDTRQITQNTMHQATVGFNADIGSGWLEGWKVDGYLQKGTNRQDFNTVNGIRVDRLWLALDAVKDASGNIVCRAALPQFDPNGLLKGCAPINLFGGTRNITPEAAAWVRDPYKVASQWVDQTVAELSTNGKLPFGLSAGQISAATGLSYRKDALDQRTIDPADEYPALPDGRLFSALGLAPSTLRGLVPQGQSGGVAGYTGFPGLRFVGSGYLGDSNSSSVQFSSLRAISGDANVKEGFVEFNIPLLKDVPFARNLETNIAARYANYSGSGGIWAYKAGLSWELNDQLRLRATRSRDVRAATLQERYDQTRGGVTVNDPKNGNAVTSAASFSGGNPLVNPEKADTTTAGFVWQPSFVEGFQTSVDWYDISVADAIAQLTAQTIVTNSQSDPALCQYVIRIGTGDCNGTGTIERVDALFINLAEQKISGVDVEMSYRRAVTLLGGGPESMSFRLYATDLMSNSTQNRGGVKDQRAGQIGSGFALPKQKATMSLNYSNGPYSVFVQGRYIGDGILDRSLIESQTAKTAANPLGGAALATIDDNHVGSVFYTDLNLRYNWEALGDFQIYANVQNLFDRAPPNSPAAIGRTGTFELTPLIHDVIGRRYVVGFNYKL